MSLSRSSISPAARTETAAIETLPAVVATAPYFCRPDELTVDDRAARLTLATGPFAHLLAQTMIELFKNARIAPQAEVVIDSLPGRKVVGERAPASSRAEHVADHIDDLAAVMLCRTPTRIDWWGVWCNEQPLRVTEIGRIRSTGHLALPRRFG